MKKLLLIITIAFVTVSVNGMELHMNLNDLISNSHLIIIGKCSQIKSAVNGKQPSVIETTVQFTDWEVVRRNGGQPLTLNQPFNIIYLGGETADRYMSACDMPKFDLGVSYMLFLLHDGTKYISPLVGGNQGLFIVKTDEITGKRYILDVNNHGVVSVEDLELKKTRFALTKIANGIPSFLIYEKDLNDIQVTDESDYAGNGQTELMSVDNFKDIIILHSFTEPSLKKWQNNSEVMPCKTWTGPSNQNNAPPPSINGGPLGACGYQDVYICLENVPSTWTSFSINKSAVANYDVYMNIYSNDPGCISTGSSTFNGGNGESEIVGWPSNSTLVSVYGYSWGTALAKTFTYSSCQCCEIVESDVAFNPAYSWVYSWTSAYNTNSINYQNVIMHELGHTWGYQRGGYYPETYDYDKPSVMHPYYNNIWEDGKEIHYMDAAVYRSVYDNQITIVDRDDIGVESYYASNGLHNCTPNTYSIQTGGSFIYRKLTIENNSDDAQSNVHVRFYLSTNKTLSSGDYLVADFNTGTRAAQSRYVHDYTIHATGVPAGTYYVAAKTSINGYSGDDRSANDVTWSTFKITIAGPRISEGDEGYLLSVFPNPSTTGMFTLHFDTDVNSEDEINVINALGQILLRKQLSVRETNNVIELDLSNYPAGIYFINYLSNNSMVRKKIVKQ